MHKIQKWMICTHLDCGGFSMKVHHLSIQCSIYPMDLIYRSLAIDNSVLDS